MSAPTAKFYRNLFRFVSFLFVSFHSCINSSRVESKSSFPEGVQTRMTDVEGNGTITGSHMQCIERTLLVQILYDFVDLSNFLSFPYPLISSPLKS